MDAGEVTFRKPDFDDDASSVTDVAPEEPVEHHHKDTDAKLQEQRDTADPQGKDLANAHANGSTTENTQHDPSAAGKPTDHLKTKRTASDDNTADRISPTPSNPDATTADSHHLSLKQTATKAAEKAKAALHLHHVHESDKRAQVHFKDPNSNDMPANLPPGESGRLPFRSRDPSTSQGRRKSSYRSIQIPHDDPTHPYSTKPRPSTSDGASEQDQEPPNLTPIKRFLTNTWTILRGVKTMFFTFPYWDMAFWSGSSYTYGSILFVIDGAWAWTPLAFPGSDFPGEAKYGVGLLFFIGALFYQIGATMAYLEAVNDGSFAGPAMKRLLEGHDEDKKKLLDEKLHAFFGHIVPHHHHDHHSKDKKNSSAGTEDDYAEREKDCDPEAGWRALDREDRPGSIYPPGKEPAPRRGGMDLGPAEEGEVHEYLTWRWWPTRHALFTYHLRELGYIATGIQLFGATLYGITGVIALPGILSSLKPWQELGGYWVPQVVASCCFLTAGIMFTLITQDVWYKPVPGKISWWIGAWATIGSVGFLLSACFGIPAGEHEWCEYQSSLSSMWGSAAYLTSSFLQWYESVNKGPVLAFPNNRVPTLLR